MAARFDAIVDETTCPFPTPGGTIEMNRKDYGVKRGAQIMRSMMGIILSAKKLIGWNEKNTARIKSLTMLPLELGRGE